jgi:hypothetical protein
MVLTAEHWWLMPIILATQEAEIRRIEVQSQPGQIEFLSRKYPTQKRAGGVVQVLECLPSKCEALSSNPSTKKKKKRKRKKERKGKERMVLTFKKHTFQAIWIQIPK